MTWFEFWASIIGSLAWPVSAAVIALMFRRQILSIFNRAQELGFGDWTLKLNRDLEGAEEVAKELPPPPDPTPDETRNDREERFAELVAISPNAAILEEWREIEFRLEEMGKRLGLDARERKRHGSIMGALRKNPLFPDSLLSLIDELRYIRNSAAHAKSVTKNDADRFRELADQVLPFLRADLFNQN